MTNQARRIVIPGGSGQIGAILARHYHALGDDVTVIARSKMQAPWKIVPWDGQTLGTWAKEIDGADIVINLAGRNVNCRYSAANRREIKESRVITINLAGQAIAQSPRPPRLWMNASIATIYRHALDRQMDEATGELGGNEPDVPDTWRFSIDVAKSWEDTFFSAATPAATRKIALRSAMVMSPDRGGVFDTLLGLVRHGLGGASGNGKQYVSWIHDRDFLQSLNFLINRRDLDGVVNISAPNPLPNEEFMAAIRAAWGTRIGLPATKWMLEVGAFFLRSETELILKSRRVVPGGLFAVVHQARPREENAERDHAFRGAKMSASAATGRQQFNWPMRILHWLMAALVLTMLGIGVAMVASLGDYHRLVSIHRPLGIAILILVVIRFVNRQFSTLPPFPPTMSAQERFIAHASEILLYSLLFVLPLIGWGMLSAARYPIVMFGSLHLFPILPHSVMLYAFLRKTHTVLAYLLFLAFIAHFGAVLFHTLVLRDGLLSRMVPWTVPAAGGFLHAAPPGISPTPSPRTARSSISSKLEATMSERYSGQLALVAGGTGGLGRAVSLAFLEEGATVAVTHRREDEFEALRQAAGAHASLLEGYSVDVTNDAAVRQLISSIIAKHGRLDAMTNAVGGYAAGWKLWEAQPAIMDQMLSLNLYSGYVLCRSVVPAMLKQGRGAIVNVAARAAIDPGPSAAAYAASKAAAVAMIDSLAADLKGTGIRANSILPSIIDTEANRRAIPDADFAKWPKPEDIAQVILFLCSDAAKLIHGASIPV